MPDPGIVLRCLLGGLAGFALGLLFLSTGGEQQVAVQESAVDMALNAPLASKAFAQPLSAFARPTMAAAAQARPYEAANACRIPGFSSLMNRARFGAMGHFMRGRMQASAVIKEGDALPSVELDKGFPPEKVNIAEFSKGKKIVIVGLPGAFTPTWSSTQIPGYLSKQDELKALNVTDVIIYAVNDGAVMTAWATDQGVAGSCLTFLGDPTSVFTKSLDLVLDAPGPMSVLGNSRCKRFSMLVEDGVVKKVNVAASDDDPAGDDNPTISLVEQMLEDIKAR